MKKRRLITILLFPALAIIFMIGLIFTKYGEGNEFRKKDKKKQTANKPYDLEMEVIDKNHELTIKS